MFLCQYYTFLITVALYYLLKSRSMNPPNLFFFNIVLDIQDILHFYMNYLCLLKKAAGILIKLHSGCRYIQGDSLEKPTDGRAWWAAVHGVTKSQTFTHWRRKWQPTPVFLPGESHGLGSLVGCRLWGRTESDTTEET